MDIRTLEQDHSPVVSLETEADLSGLTLEELRAVKSVCDMAIIEAIAQRQTVTDEIGRRKAASGEPVQVHSEELRTLDGVRSLAESMGVDTGLVTDLWQRLLETSRRRQSEYRRGLGAVAVGMVGAVKE